MSWNTWSILLRSATISIKLYYIYIAARHFVENFFVIRGHHDVFETDDVIPHEGCTRQRLCACPSP